MFGWFYKMVAASRFKSQARLPFGLIRAFKEEILECIEEIIVTTETKYIKLSAYFNKYNVLRNSLEECYFSKDEFDYVKKYSDPIITPSQESRLRFLRSMLWLSMVVFFVVETMLFYMIAQNITGGMSSLVEAGGTKDNIEQRVAWFLFVASGMFALISALMLDAGLRQLLHYFRAKKHFENKFIDLAKLRAATTNLALGITLIIGTIVVLVLMNLARSYALDNSTNTESSNPMLAHAMVALSVFAGISFGLIKKELAENSELLSLAKKWKNIKSDMAITHAGMTYLSIRIHNTYSLAVIKSQSLGMDLQELMEREFDTRDTELATEFKEELMAGKFFRKNADGSIKAAISPEDAHYYGNLTTNEALLHHNHFASHERLNAIMGDVDKMVSVVNKMEGDRLSKLNGGNGTSQNHQVNIKSNVATKVESSQVEAAPTHSENMLDRVHLSNHSLNVSTINH